MAHTLSTPPPASSDPKADPLLTTHLSIPQPRPNLVPRPRLTERLDEGLGALTLILAPASFGKTTLLSEWIAVSAGKLPIAWITLHERDDDPHRFWTYLLAALGQLTLEPDESILFSSDLSEDLLTALIDKITVEMPDDFVLILDDYHLITAQSVHAAMAFLLDHSPPQMHLLIASRVEPPLPLARLRARGQLVELRASDLRFTLDEAVTFLNQVMGLALTAEMVAALDARTEGWIAGLQLASLALQARLSTGQRNTLSEFIQAFRGTHRYVVDYLAEQVLCQQLPDIQTFLLETSILERLTGPLCDAITGQTQSRAKLEWLERANLFLFPLDDDRRWYRYHPLFSDFLRERLWQTQPDRHAELHRRAAEWFEHNGSMEDAVRHALKARYFEMAIRLIEQASYMAWRRHQARTLLSWIKAIPEELVHSNPRLCLTYASALEVCGQFDAVEPLLQSAEAILLKADPSQAGTTQALLAQVDYVRAFAARLRSIPDAIAFSRRALERIPSDQLWMRSMALLSLGHAYFLNGDAEAASRTLIESSEASRAGGNIAAYLNAIHWLAQLRVLQGQLRQAAAIYQQALQWVAEQDKAAFYWH